MRLWQGIDEDSGKIGAIPASPFLLPALILMLLAPFIELLLGLIGFWAAPKIPLTEEQYQKCKQRYHYLIHKRRVKWLTPEETRELEELTYPSWNDTPYFPFKWN